MVERPSEDVDLFTTAISEEQFATASAAASSRLANGLSTISINCGFWYRIGWRINYALMIVYGPPTLGGEESQTHACLSALSAKPDA
jgi:hypothetical protein